jgi:hypothetical protein
MRHVQESVGAREQEIERGAIHRTRTWQITLHES